MATKFEDAREVVRQIQKRDEWLVKMGTALDAAIEAESHIEVKKKELQEISKLVDEAKATHDDLVKNLNSEADKLKIDLDTDFRKRSEEAADAVAVLEKKRDDLTAENLKLEEEIKVKTAAFQKQKNDVAASFKSVTDAHEKALKDMNTEKAVLQKQLDDLRSAIAGVRNRVAALGA